MPRDSEGGVLVVADTSVLLNFLNLRRLDLLCDSSGYRIIITEHVRSEVTDDDQAEALTAAIASGRIEEIELAELDELALFAKLTAVLGRGESAAIALAASRGWSLAIDEKGRARREAEACIGKGRLLNTAGVVLQCIRNGTLTVAEADGLKDDLRTYRFVIKLKSFGELLP